MNIRIKATNTTLTEAVKSYIEKKLQSLDTFIRPEEKVLVELQVDSKNKSGQRYRTEVDIQPHGHYAEARGSDPYESIDLVVPKIKEQVLKEKDKKISKRRQKKGIKGLV
jgi:ribosomal subunit interface protein